MATNTFQHIRTELDLGAYAITEALESEPIDIDAIHSELARLQALSAHIAAIMERIRETWGPE